MPLVQAVSELAVADARLCLCDEEGNCGTYLIRIEIIGSDNIQYYTGIRSAE